VVDSLVAFSNVDENDAGEVRGYMQGFRQLAGMGATLVVLHHSGKGESSKQYRGSSDIAASIDTGYRLVNFNADESLQLDTLTLKTFKARCNVLPEIVLHYKDGLFSMDTRAACLSNADILIAILKATPGITKTAFEEAAKHGGVSLRRARDFLSERVVDGAVQITVGPHNIHCISWTGGISDPGDTLPLGGQQLH
jgi:hypothetical protein